jgi:hypothetical protein
MEDTFAQLLSKEFNWKYTENGADARKSTGSDLLDLYATAGALRTRPADVVQMFASAFVEDALLATKLSFHARNIRGGLGERQVSRFMWRWLAFNFPEVIEKNLRYVPFFGRWDDVYVFVGTPVESDVWGMVGMQIKEDLQNVRKGKPCSLLAKWLKSVNTSSEESRHLGKYTANALGYSERDYRRMLSYLRTALGNAVVETKMSANNWGEIDFEKVCSKAMSNSRKAFSKHDGERFGAYIEAVKHGDAVIHSSTLYPYDIFEKMGFQEGNRWDRNGSASFEFSSWDNVLQAQWDALPNYIEDGENVIVVADTSGSMQGRPIATSVGLAVYFAERNKGQFAGKFITFSSRPSFVEIKGKTLKEKISRVPAIVENTDLNAVFDLVLKVAVENRVSEDDMPKMLLIISDMEIDSADNSSRKRSFTDYQKEKYRNSGYTLPQVVYWQVNSRGTPTFHAEKDSRGIQLASGQSAAVFKSILKSTSFTPMDAMVEVLNSEQYDCITI